MSSLKIYEYAKCGTCVKAKKYLKEHQIPFQEIPIVDTPPSRAELEQMLTHLKSRGLKINKLFNTSGVLYKEMELSKKLPSMSENELLDLLAQHGKLIKRPFVLLKNDGLVGFNEAEWKEKIG